MLDPLSTLVAHNLGITLTGCLTAQKIDNLILISPGFDHYTKQKFFQDSCKTMEEEGRQFLVAEFKDSTRSEDIQKLLNDLKIMNIVDERTRIDFLGHGEYKGSPINVLSIQIDGKFNEHEIKEKILAKANKKEELKLPILYKISEKYYEYYEIDIKTDPSGKEVFDVKEKELESAKDVHVGKEISKFSSKEKMEKELSKIKIQDLGQNDRTSFPMLAKIPVQNTMYYTLYTKENALCFDEMDFSEVYHTRYPGPAKVHISLGGEFVINHIPSKSKDEDLCEAQEIIISSNALRYLAQAKNVPFTSIHKDLPKHHDIDRLFWFNNNKGEVSSIDVFKDLQERLRVKNFHLWACHGGAAQYQADKLQQGSSVVTHSGAKYTIPIASLLDSLIGSISTKSEFESFMIGLLKSPETIYFIGRTEDNKTCTFKACAPKDPLPMNELKLYLAQQADDFIKFVSEHFSPAQEVLDQLEQIKNNGVHDQDLKEYMARDIFIEISRDLNKNTLKYLKYIDYDADLDVHIMGKSLREGLGEDMLTKIRALNKQIDEEMGSTAVEITPTRSSKKSIEIPFQSLKESEKKLYNEIKNKKLSW